MIGLKKKLLIFLVILAVNLIFLCLKPHFVKTRSEERHNSNSKLVDVAFNRSTDLIAFLHIQKTSGTNFENIIVHNLKIFISFTKKLENACLLKPLSSQSNSKYAKYYCPRDDSSYFNDKSLSIQNSWFLSRQTYGWAMHWKCNVHSDFAKFKYCTDIIKKENKFLKKIHFVTLIREPVQRYVSEWKHVARETKDDIKLTFNAKNICNKEVSMFDCVPNKVKNLSLDDFLSCKNNMAENRQTRLLAYYDQTKRNSCDIFKKENKLKLLENAKQVLSKQISFFGLTEYDDFTRKLFEKTFKNSFKFEGVKNETNLKAKKYIQTIDSGLIQKIKKLNDLDLELYDYAKTLFFERLQIHDIFIET